MVKVEFIALAQRSSRVRGSSRAGAQEYMGVGHSQRIGVPHQPGRDIGLDLRGPLTTTYSSASYPPSAQLRLPAEFSARAVGTGHAEKRNNQTCGTWARLITRPSPGRVIGNSIRPRTVPVSGIGDQHRRLRRYDTACMGVPFRPTRVNDALTSRGVGLVRTGSRGRVRDRGAFGIGGS